MRVPGWTGAMLLVAGASSLTSVGASGQAADSISRPLTSVEKLAIDSGRQVVREVKVIGSPWPRVTVVQFIDATPEEAAAVFADYARHATYFPGLKRSTISRRVNPRVSEVDYVLGVPLYADESYTVRDSISGDPARGSYRVDWKRVRARSTKEIAGSAVFEPWLNAATSAEGTLVTYSNLVVPGQMLAAPFKARALRQVRETVTALARQVEHERRNDPALLAAQVRVLSAAVTP